MSNYTKKGVVTIAKNKIITFCGYIRTGEEKLTKSNRIYICPNCCHEEDRDINTSKNIALTQEYEIISA